MPALMEFHEKYKAHQDKFEIIAFHSASAPTFEFLDKKMKSIIEKVWKGKDIPFPSMLDATGRTLRNFSVTSLGTHVLIDPKGNLVCGHGEKTIEEAILESIRKDADGKDSKSAPVKKPKRRKLQP